MRAAGEVKLLDLGLARFYADGGSGVSPGTAGEEMTGTGQAMGTADYMAPEQASDSRTVDIRADIYSLGCTLYKLLSGRAPFSGRRYVSPGQDERPRSSTGPADRRRCPGGPEELAAILDRMLAKDPGDRFATPADVAAGPGTLLQGRESGGSYGVRDGDRGMPTLPTNLRSGAERVPDSSSLPRRAILGES